MSSASADNYKIGALVPKSFEDKTGSSGKTSQVLKTTGVPNGLSWFGGSGLGTLTTIPIDAQIVGNDTVTELYSNNFAVGVYIVQFCFTVYTETSTFYNLDAHIENSYTKYDTLTGVSDTGFTLFALNASQTVVISNSGNALIKLTLYGITNDNQPYNISAADNTVPSVINILKLN